jgi:iron-sulfur cluster assembly protein
MDIITFSPAALAQIKRSASESEHGHLPLRIAAQVMPDESISYGMGYDESKEDDVQFEKDGISFVISPVCLELLNGAHIDFVEIEEGQQHFIFLNPNDPNYKPPTEEGALDDNL